jgi:acetylglutamate kinase
MQVIKVGGNELDEQAFLTDLARTVKSMDEPAVIVHGGGQAIADMQARLGLKTVMVDGLRVTDADSLAVVQMVLSGRSNKIIVAALLAAGVDAVGISGVDGGLLRCVKKQHPAADLGYVGQVVEVRSEMVRQFANQGMTPVISPISLGSEGQIYNVNADEAAGAIAASLGVSVVNFVSNVPGVLDEDDNTIPALSAAQTEHLIRRGVIHGGMVPKVRAALEVVGQGVPNARIVNLSGLANGSGTLFTA